MLQGKNSESIWLSSQHLPPLLPALGVSYSKFLSAQHSQIAKPLLTSLTAGAFLLPGSQTKIHPEPRFSRSLYGLNFDTHLRSHFNDFYLSKIWVFCCGLSWQFWVVSNRPTMYFVLTHCS